MPHPSGASKEEKAARVEASPQRTDSAETTVSRASSASPASLASPASSANRVAKASSERAMAASATTRTAAGTTSRSPRKADPPTAAAAAGREVDRLSANFRVPVAIGAIDRTAVVATSKTNPKSKSSAKHALGPRLVSSLTSMMPFLLTLQAETSKTSSPFRSSRTPSWWTPFSTTCVAAVMTVQRQFRGTPFPSSSVVGISWRAPRQAVVRRAVSWSLA
mmetsp:Transcript_89748/g.187503  ORF Transcript_89748/g.187503 Transcript_89748/m.187503 type:complete len:221 (+) Transcript_89748:239-901(+)